MWGTIKEMTDVGLSFRELDGMAGMVEEMDDGTWQIVIDSRLDPIQQRIAAAHEITHVLRGLTFTSVVPDVLVDLEELRVDMEATSRLVPPLELATWAQGVVAGGGCVSLASIAERFEVDELVARRGVAIAVAPWVTGFGLDGHLHRLPA